MNGDSFVADPLSKATHSLALHEYSNSSASTDIIPSNDLKTILFGLFGEVGQIMSTSKKLVREGDAYIAYRRSAEEEFGDTLWYFSAACRRLNFCLDQIFLDAIDNDDFSCIGTASDHPAGALSHTFVPRPPIILDEELFNLGQTVALLLSPSPTREHLVLFAKYYLRALYGAQLEFSIVARSNLSKARGAFLSPNASALIDFDQDFPSDEQLPRTFRIRVTQRPSGKTYLQWNGVFIGDPLTDNIADRDDYRFHDVFHFAYAAILHWSPVIRAIIKQKRKSNPSYDEDQDSGRAIVVEEGLTAWLFARARDMQFFENQSRISYGILKTVAEFVSGYEVSSCPAKLWERAILDGYSVFRQLRRSRGGWIVGDRAARTISFEPLEPGL